MVALGLVGFVGLVALLYVLSVHAAPSNSDGASVVLEGQSLQAGHLTLAGWRLSFDSFWTVDAPFYAIAVAIFGVRSMLMHLVPAVLAALVITVGAALARSGRRGWAGWAGALTVVALLAFPSHALASFFLLGPLHVGTSLWCLLAFAALCLVQGRWRIALAACLLAAGLLGDLQTLAFGVAPVFVAGLAASARHRSWRAGAAALLTAAGSLAVAGVVRLVAKAIGTFHIAHSERAAGRQMIRNVRLEPGYLARLFGVGTRGFGTGGAPAALVVVHVVGLAAVVAAVVAAVGSLVWGAVAGRPAASGVRRRGSGVVLEDVLAVAVLADLVMFVALTLSSTNVTFARYLVPSVIFGAVLAGRWVAALADRRLPSPLRRTGAVAGVAVLACLAIGVGAQIGSPAPAQAQGSLGDFLADHGLYRGIGDYWTSSIITVDTGGQVTVRPVMTDPQGRLEGYDRESESAWYTGRRFQFLIYYVATPTNGVDATSARATFGRPSQTYTMGGYQILVWPHPVEVPAGTSAGPGAAL